MKNGSLYFINEYNFLFIIMFISFIYSIICLYSLFFPFAAVIGGFVVGILAAILLVMFIVYRMRKKDEGSYALDEQKQPPIYPYAYQKAPTKEFYAWKLLITFCLINFSLFFVFNLYVYIFFLVSRYFYHCSLFILIKKKKNFFFYFFSCSFLDYVAQFFFQTCFDFIFVLISFFFPSFFFCLKTKSLNKCLI